MKGCKGYPGTAGVHSGCMKRHVLPVAGLLLHASLAFGGEFSDDLAARRARMMERLGPDAMPVLFSAPTRNYSLDVDYEYRQDSNLYYLTGLPQQDTILVLMPGNASRREVLFVKRPESRARALERPDAAARRSRAS